MKIEEEAPQYEIYPSPIEWMSDKEYSKKAYDLSTKIYEVLKPFEGKEQTEILRYKLGKLIKKLVDESDLKDYF